MMSILYLSILHSCLLVVALAQTTSQYDAALAGTQWYVPSSSLLGYYSFNSFDHKIPVSSQNVFNITSCVNGYMEGTNNITTVVGTSPPSYTPSTFTAQISSSGGLTIQMMTAGSSRLMYWYGQVLTLASGELQLQIQMMSQGDGLYFNHWMNMNQSTSDTILPANSVQIEMTQYNNQSANFRWLVGTNWTFHYTPLYPPTQTTTLFVTGFYNGYFWGLGTSSSVATSIESNLTFFGSVVPEGRLIFEILDAQNELTVFWGNLTYTMDDDDYEIESGLMSMMNCSITSVVGPYAYATLNVNDGDDNNDDDNTDTYIGIGIGLGAPFVIGVAFAGYYYYTSTLAKPKVPLASQRVGHSMEII